MTEEKHCDEYIDDPTQPEVLRKYLKRARSPAHGLFDETPFPKLFAEYKGTKVRVVMASRWGDVGITEDISSEHEYSKRVGVHELSNFSDNGPTSPVHGSFPSMSNYGMKSFYDDAGPKTPKERFQQMHSKPIRSVKHI